ncbi:right-handed parallel beta-helix repeat-containing protein [Eisenibacter elegans]|jgi:hypothetical protein|uniref:right-handed parallel beta-helix repeat-containing protein n=1 Tax=Eisenibacter elegans TaxID=997 RepID=UPI0004035CF6|nr:right-handed parallel beta-helix repeat-containing protein [Eisenibacter elegans]
MYFKQTFAFLLWMAFGLVSSLYAQQTVKVATTEDFLKALGSNRTIVMAPGDYVLSNFEYLGLADYREAYDGYELLLSDFKNLTIKSADAKKPAHLIAEPQYGYVLVFVGCQNICIEGVRAGHGPEKGGCAGGVFSFEDCQNVTVSNSTLYGSGTEGITASNTQDLRCENSIIEECTYHIGTFSNGSKAVFSNCTFRKNQEFSMINLRDGSTLVFDKCRFLDNTAYNAAYPDFSDPVFDHETGSTITLKACIFKGNRAGYFARRQAGITLAKTDPAATKNTYVKGLYAE